MTDEELDALVRDAVFAADCLQETGTFETAQGVLHDCATAITTLRAQLAEARAELDSRVDMHECAMAERDDATLYSEEQQARAEQAEAALAAQTEADAGVDPEKFLELVIYAAKEAREKALREAVRSLCRRKAVYLLKARKAMRSAGEVQDPDLQSQQWEKRDQMMHTAKAHDYAIADILALIEKQG